MPANWSTTLSAAALALGLAFPLAAEEHAVTQDRPSVDELVSYFETVVFGSEFAGIAAAPAIRKWQLPLRVVVREYGEVVTITSGGREIRRLDAVPVAPQHVAYVQKHLNTLAVLTGLKTQDAKKTRWPPNFTIKFVPPLQLTNPQLANVEPGIIKRLGAQGGCYFVTDDAAYAITQAVFTNFEKFRSMHPALKYLSKADMAKSALSAPLHPGAQRYYEEAGLR